MKGNLSQSSVGNYQASGSNQQPHTMYYSYPQSQQLILPGGVSALPPGQTVYVIPAQVSPATTSQPLTINQSDTSRLIRTEPRDRAHEPDPYDDPSTNCCALILLIAVGFIVCALVAFFLLELNHILK